MIDSRSAGVRTRDLFAVLATGALLLAGCSSPMTTSESSPVAVANARVTGRVHGGNQPVAGATVTLYRANQNGFATGAVALATTSSSSDGYGAFNFTESASAPNDGTTDTYSCLVGGTDTNPTLFVVARGGTTTNTVGAVANPNAVFIAPMGSCDAVTSTTFVDMSEVVTVATMAAIHQFMDPTAAQMETTVGADGVFVSTAALTNAFNTVSNLVSMSTGLGLAPFTKTGNDPNGGLGVAVTLTPELAKINQLANAVSSCINYSGSGNPNCTTLFSNATPPASASSTSVPGATLSPATDILTALYYLFTNPVSADATTRANIYDLSAASGAPYQPTLSAVPTDWSIGIAYSSTSNCAGSTAGFINTPYALDVDRYGDIWIGNNQAGAGSLGHLRADGTPSSCTTLTPTNGSGNASLGSQSVAIDTAGNIYSGLLRSYDIYRFTPSASASTPVDIPTAGPVLSLAADGSGDIFYATTAGNLYEIANAATLSSFTLANSVQISTIPLGTPTRMIVDAAGRIWASSGSTFVTYTQASSGVYTTFSVSTTSAVNDVTVGAANAGTTNVYTVTTGANEVQNFSITSGNVVTQNAAFTGAGLTGPFALALDGSANTWMANNGAPSVSAFTASGGSLSSTTGLQKSSTYFAGSQGITVDTAGNLWVAAGTNTVTEVVGAAVPVYKSYAIALSTGRFQTIP